MSKCLQAYRLIGVVLLEDLLRFLLPAVGEEHDDLVAVGPRHVHLRDERVKRFKSAIEESE